MSSIGSVGTSIDYSPAFTKRGSGLTSEGAGPLLSNGSPATVLSLSPAASAAVSSGNAATKSFAAVTADARTMLTANQAAMKASGHVLGMGENQGTQADIDAAFAGLDRRSLFAIASNSEGLFTDVEQKFAQSAMSQQQAGAMGLNNATGFMSDPSAGFLSGIGFLDSVSPEEKASDNWRVNRAGLQASYRSNFRDDHRGDVAKNVDSGDPVVNLLAKVIQGARDTLTSTTDGSYVTDIGKIPLFADGKYDAVLQQARSQLGNNGQRRVDVTA
jgi:hypothetical protein